MRFHSPLATTLCGFSWKIGVAPRMFKAFMTMVSRCGRSLTSPRWPPGSFPSFSMRPPQCASSCPVSRQITKRKSVSGRMQGTCRLRGSSPKRAPSTNGHPCSPQRPMLPLPISMDAAVSEASASRRITSTLALGSVNTKPLRSGTAKAVPTRSEPSHSQPLGGTGMAPFHRPSSTRGLASKEPATAFCSCCPRGPGGARGATRLSCSTCSFHIRL
mmetsp:Transcript_18941/g.44074  ORF Transcript_18941/g.44074 Transcript_18941/m.44074 type:complete len:216 (-) Transcript_18941:439-1086(-)